MAHVLAPVGLRHHLAGAVLEVEQLFGLGAQDQSGRGQPHAALGPLEQLGAHLGLQLLDLQAQGRLGHVEPARGAREVQFVGEYQKGRQDAQFKWVVHIQRLYKSDTQVILEI